MPTCPRCKGTGQVNDGVACSECLGRGELPICDECGAKATTAPPCHEPKEHRWCCHNYDCEGYKSPEEVSYE